MPPIESAHPSLSAAPDTAQAAGSQRQKITRACEPCRRRKVKCSGLVPCSFCVKHSFQCEFISTRHRRGPRPKARPNTSGIPSVEVVPGDLSANKRPVNTTTANVTDVIPLPVQQSRESSTSSRQEDDQREWLEALRRTVPNDNILDSRDLEESLKLRCHLIEVFFADVNCQQTPMLDVDYFFGILTNNKCSECLINAICGASVPWSRHRALMSMSGTNLRQRLISTARSQMVHAVSQNEHLNRLQTLCVLITCEFAAGSGGQAWCDIATARSLLQLSALQNKLSPEISNVLKIASTHLLIFERLLCLGYPGLLPSIKLDSEEVNLLDNSWKLASQLLDLLIYIQRSSSAWVTGHNPAPWAPDSKFIDAVNKADSYMMREFDGLRFDSKSICSMLEKRNSAAPHIISLLAWHCCIVLLNRVFLPIPQLNETRTETSEPKEKITLTFPNAPKAFLAERIRTCEASSTIICNISRIIVSGENLFMPSFLGYCCFQSSVVMINQLKCTGGTTYETVDNLKVNFTILGAMGRFYKPSMTWSEVLFQLHRVDSILECEAFPLVEMFATYFSRFKGAREPPYVRLDVLSEDAPRDTARNTSPVIEGTSNPLPDEETLEVTGNDEWIREYEGCLAEQLDGLGDGQHRDTAETQVTVSTSRFQNKSPGEQSSWEGTVHPHRPNQTSLGPASYTPAVAVNLPPSSPQHTQEDTESSSYAPEGGGMYATIPLNTKNPFQPGTEETSNPQVQALLSASGDHPNDLYTSLSFEEIDFARYFQVGERMFQPSEQLNGFEYCLDGMDWESLSFVPDAIPGQSK